MKVFSKFVVPACCGQIWRISSYCLKIHGKNIYGTVDPSSTRIFHFWREDEDEKLVCIYISPTWEISKNISKLLNQLNPFFFLEISKDSSNYQIDAKSSQEVVDYQRIETKI